MQLSGDDRWTIVNALANYKWICIKSAQGARNVLHHNVADSFDQTVLDCERLAELLEEHDTIEFS